MTASSPSPPLPSVSLPSAATGTSTPSSTASPTPILGSPTEGPQPQSLGAGSLTPLQMAHLAAALPRIGPLTDLLAQLLAALESPSGDAGRRLEAMAAEIEGLATGLAATATALTAMASQGGLLATLGARLDRLEVEMAAMRRERTEEARAQAGRDALMLDLLDRTMSWLGAPLVGEASDRGETETRRD